MKFIFLDSFDLVWNGKTARYNNGVSGSHNATMYLGDVILDSLTSPLGDVKDQEGVVIRDKAVYDKPYKITGSFILRGLQTAFGK